MNLPCLCIDIAKVKFNACLLQLTGKLKHKVFSNNAAGFAQLHEWLEKQLVSQVHASTPRGLPARGPRPAWKLPALTEKRSRTSCTSKAIPSV